MRRGWWVALAVSWLGCSEKSAPDAGTPLAIEEAVVARCAQQVPPELRSQFLSGFAEVTSPRFESTHPQGLSVCAFRADGGTVTLAFDCRHRPSDGQLERTREALLEQEGLELPDLGRAAVRAEARPDTEQLTAWDDDSPCSVTTTWLGEGRDQTVELTRQVLLLAGAAPVPPDAGAPPSLQSPGPADGGAAEVPDAG